MVRTDKIAEDASSAPYGSLSALMTAAQSGDRISYDRLLRLCDPLIRSVARRTGVPPDRLDDAVQDTLLTLHDARRAYDPSRSFEAWLTVIARRRSIDLLRRTGRVGRREVHAPLAFEEAPCSDADTIRSLERRDDAEALHRAIADLTPVQREAVQRLAIGEQSLVQAAAESGRTTGALKVSLHRAIKALRVRLATGHEAVSELRGKDHDV